MQIWDQFSAQTHTHTHTDTATHTHTHTHRHTPTHIHTRRNTSAYVFLGLIKRKQKMSDLLTSMKLLWSNRWQNSKVLVNSVTSITFSLTDDKFRAEFFIFAITFVQAFHCQVSTEFLLREFTNTVSQYRLMQIQKESKHQTLFGNNSEQLFTIQFTIQTKLFQRNSKCYRCRSTCDRRSNPSHWRGIILLLTPLLTTLDVKPTVQNKWICNSW